MKDRILINNFVNVENYLNLSAYEGKQLKYAELRKNRHIKGVRELLEKIPSGNDIKDLQDFYEETGLKLQVERFDSEWNYCQIDRKGVYPPPDCIVGTPRWDFYAEHAELLEAQEIPDIIVRYVEPIKRELRKPLKKKKLRY